HRHHPRITLEDGSGSRFVLPRLLSDHPAAHDVTADVRRYDDVDEVADGIELREAQGVDAGAEGVEEVLPLYGAQIDHGRADQEQQRDYLDRQLTEDVDQLPVIDDEDERRDDREREKV